MRRLHSSKEVVQHSVSVQLDLNLSPEVQLVVLREVIKFLLLNRGQIPATYTELLELRQSFYQRLVHSGTKTRRKPAGVRVLDKFLEPAAKLLAALGPSSVPAGTAKFAVAFGSSPIRAKELYHVVFPQPEAEIALSAGSPAITLYQMQDLVRKVQRSLLTAYNTIPQWQDPLGITKMFTMMQVNTQTTSAEDAPTISTIPADQASWPTTAEEASWPATDQPAGWPVQTGMFVPKRNFSAAKARKALQVTIVVQTNQASRMTKSPSVVGPVAFSQSMIDVLQQSTAALSLKPADAMEEDITSRPCPDQGSGGSNHHAAGYHNTLPHGLSSSACDTANGPAVDTIIYPCGAGLRRAAGGVAPAQCGGLQHIQQPAITMCGKTPEGGAMVSGAAMAGGDSASAATVTEVEMDPQQGAASMAPAVEAIWYQCKVVVKGLKTKQSN